MGVAVGTFGLSTGSSVNAVADSDWLGVVNTYRAMSGLDAVSADATWSAQAEAHSCYMLQNGISHDEIPGRPGYTPGGDLAGNNGNVAVSSSIAASARNHIDLWMTGPFHAIGILRPNLTTSGFGLCTNASTPTWRSGGTLDVLRGIDNSKPKPTSAVVFPGDGATVPLHSFITEYPNPVDLCGWSGSAGLPLIAMLPNDLSTANSTLSGPNGPISTCTLHEGNTGANGLAQAILDGDNAVVVMPREPLADGTYTATVNSDGGSTTWSFTVDRDAPLSAEVPELPDTEPTATSARFESVDPFRHVDSREALGSVRLRGGKITRIPVAGDDVVAVSANFVAVNPENHGFVTAFNCTTELPTVSTIGYGPGDVVANQAIVPLQSGDMCLYSLKSTDIVVDINGYYTTKGGDGLQPLTPKRLYDSRDAGETKLRAGVELPIQIAGEFGSAPAGAPSVAMNVTVTEPTDHGFLQVYPCGSSTGSQISSINYTPMESRPNSVVTPLDDRGRICVRSLRDTHVIIDVTAYFAETSGYDFIALDPIRLFDSRSRHDDLNSTTNGTRVKAGQMARLDIAGNRGVPADAKAVSINVTAVMADGPTFVTVYPCGKRPTTSNLNLLPWEPVAANGAIVKLSLSGELCVYTLDDAHLIVDINGVWI